MLHHNELINIEEDTILGPRSMLRRFTLQNRVNQLAVCILTSGGTLSSCKLDNGQHEAVVNYSSNGGKRPDGSGDVGNMVNFVPPPPVQLPLVEWQSHVLGLDSLLLTTTPSQQLLYQLTTNNELLVTGKLKGQLTAMAPFYFNLVSSELSGCPIYVRTLPKGKLTA